MKHVFSFVAAVMLASAAWAQTTVTLTVDMSNEMVSPDGVHVAGSFQGWQPDSTPMTDNGDGTWSHSFTSDTAGAFQYKFINGNTWGDVEGVPGVCAYTGDGNRQIEVDGMASEVSQTVCYSSCLACGDESTLIRFRIDMSNEVVSPFGVHVAGDFQGWDPAATELTDPDGDMIYESLEVLTSDITEIEYKIINGNVWSDPNESLIGLECGNVNGNRTLSMDGQSEIILSANGAGDAYCFNQCSSCVLPLQVTFIVDMSVVDAVSDQGVHLAGTFQGWDPEATMLDDNGDGTWSTTLEVSPGEHQFKFINGIGWNGGEEQMASTGCNSGGDRTATFGEENTIYEACFNFCPGAACLPDPEPAELTFQVDASELDLADTSIFVFGAFTGWQGGAIEMDDMGDGIWNTTAVVSGSVNVDYKYSIGHPDLGGDESGTFVTLSGDTTNFLAQDCGVSNGYENGFNRRFERSGVDEIIPLHCYNRCGACLGAVGCTDNTACNYDPDAEVDNGSCFYVADPCDDMDDMTVNDVVNADCDCVGEAAVEGCTDNTACNFMADANVEDGSCLYTDDTCDDMDATTINDMINDACECVGEPIVEGCTDPEACNFDPNANSDDGTCDELDAVGVCGGDCFADTNNDGECDEIITEGCTNVQACNYVPDANVDDGSCLIVGAACDDMDDMTIDDTVSEDCECEGIMAISGCTNEMACNYDEMANTDDGSCLVIGEACDDMDDMTFDDIVNDSCECVGTLMVLGCLDSTACNYVMDANTDDGSCEFPGDDCDDMDVNTINDMLSDSCVCVGEDTTTFVFEFERLEFGMFPNPTTGEVTLRVDGFHAGVTMQVMDGAGRVVWSQQNLALQGNTVIDLSRLSAGTYNVMLSDERGISVKRLAIQK